MFDNAEKGVSTAFLQSGWSLIFNSGQCEPSTAEGRGMLLVIESGVVEMENVFGGWFTIEFPELLCVGRILLIGLPLTCCLRLVSCLQCGWGTSECLTGV